jgi:ATP-dependent Clp protease protease subunit
MFKIILAATLLAAMNQSKAANIVLTENNSVVFNKQVTGEYISKKTLEVLAKSTKANPIYLVLDTPGGSVTAGLQFIDSIKSLNVQVHTITLFAASMGYQMVQELGRRYITQSGTLMSHRGAVSGMSGQIPGELNSRVAFIQSLLDGMSERAAKRLNISKKDYDAAVVNELWSYGDAAVASNQADEIAKVTCSKELLSGSVTEVELTIFGPVEIVFSKCPLIVAPIKITFSRQIKFEDAQRIKHQLTNQKRKGFLTF